MYVLSRQKGEWTLGGSINFIYEHLLCSIRYKTLRTYWKKRGKQKLLLFLSPKIWFKFKLVIGNIWIEIQCVQGSTPQSPPHFTKGALTGNEHTPTGQNSYAIQKWGYVVLHCFLLLILVIWRNVKWGATCTGLWPGLGAASFASLSAETWQWNRLHKELHTQ